MNTKSILDQEFPLQSRPYSQNELNFLLEQNKNRLNLSTLFAEHHECKHKYLVKSNGRKEKDIKDRISNGNCSVCWRLSKVPKHNYDRACYLLDRYNELAYDYCLSYDNVMCEILFYKWLYSG